MRVLNWTFLLSFIFVVACEQASEEVIPIPNVQLGCTTDNSPDCNNGNSGAITAYVRMTRSGCGSSLGFEPVATGSVALRCDSQGCEGIISSWTNPETFEPVNEILSGRMDVCAFIDLDGTSVDPDNNDLVNESSRSITSGATITIDTWDLDQ